MNFILCQQDLEFIFTFLNNRLTQQELKLWVNKVLT